MAKIIEIRLDRTTAYVPKDTWIPGKYDKELMQIVGGVHDLVEVPPGEAFRIEEEEGRRLVERFGGMVLGEGGRPTLTAETQPMYEGAKFTSAPPPVEDGFTPPAASRKK